MQLCQAHTGDMVAVLVEIANSRNASPASRAVAAQAILDRGNGKPLQAVAHGDPDGNPLKMTATIILTGKPDPEES
jgi:hypothetical protein